ncbi:MAG: beta-ketoacyl synthase chain length factor [Rubrivivax sp.]|nr:beta-ketoacyl synthase chain length factor [Rubrivivax sp.]MDP3615316.1 beta-ketoacyl synthase chain length factor [Rubrivivax sp.]
MTHAGTRRLWIDAVAWWSPGLPDWQQAQAALRGEATASAPSTGPTARPAPALLAANERRRAPDAVLLALEVAARASADSGHDTPTLATVFASAHGDLPITDALCRTLASDPLLLSPTRFHHSVHNAASGYWAIGSGSTAASTALAAFENTFATGLLEAACQCHADSRPVMLVACDTQAVGPLASVNRSRGLLAVALVFSPVAGPRSGWVLDWSLQAKAVPQPLARSATAWQLSNNASSAALPMMEALAGAGEARLAWPLSTGLLLQLQLQTWPAAAGTSAAA